MEFSVLTNIILTLVILIVFVYVVAGQLMKRWVVEIDYRWQKLLLKITQRDDVIPLMIERLSTVYDRKSFAELIELRQKAFKQDKSNAEKVELEINLSRKMREILENAKQQETLQNDLMLNSLRKEYTKAGREIESELEIYNEKVRRFNGTASNILLLPIRRILKISPRNIFEYEI